MEKQKKQNESIETKSTKIIENLRGLIFDVFSIKNKFSKLIEEHLSYDEIAVSRIFFVRHGHTLICDKVGKEKKENDVSLSKKGLGHMNMALEEINKIKIDSNVTRIWCSSSTCRVFESSELISNGLGIDNIRRNADGLGSIPKNKYGSEMGSKLSAGEMHNRFYEEELLPYLSEHIGENIILIVNKSCISNLENRIKEKKYDYYTGYDYNYGEIREWDFNMGKKFINKEKRNDILFLNSTNIENIKDLLRDESEIRDIITLFEIGRINILELQNYINAYFREYTSLYEKYLNKGSLDIKVFCIANLVKIDNFDIVEDNLQKILEKEDDSTMISLVDSLFGIFNDEQIEIFLEFLEDDLDVGYWLTDKLQTKKGKLDFYMNYLEYTKKSITEIRKRNLNGNGNIEDGENILIPIDFQGEKYKHIDNLLQSKGIKLIEGEAGAGKSTKLLEIMEYLKPDDENIYFPIYVSLGGKSFSDIKRDVKNQKKSLTGNGKYRFVIMFDAIDESRLQTSEKKKFWEFVDKLSKDNLVLITSRPGIEKADNLDLEIIRLQSLSTEQIDNYVNFHLTEKQKELWEEWKNKEFIQTIQHNPLMLSIVCSLLDSGENLEGVNTILDLYDRIIDRRLLDWESEKIIRSSTKGVLDYRKKLLGEIALYTFKKDKEINNGYIRAIIKFKGDIYEGRIPENREGEYELECLNVLFKKNKEGDYDFIHESFKEYFVAYSYIGKIFKKNQMDIELMYSLFTKDMNNNINYYIIWKFVFLNKKFRFRDNLFDYLRRVLNEEKYDSEKVEFLLFFIYGVLGDSFKNDYLGSIKLTTKMIEILGILGGDNNKKLIKKNKDSEMEDVRIQIIESLGYYGGTEDMDFLKKEFVNDKSIEVKSKLIEVICDKISWGYFRNEDIEFIKLFIDDKEVEQFYNVKIFSILRVLDFDFVEELLKKVNINSVFVYRLQCMGYKNIEILILLKNIDNIELLDDLLGIISRSELSDRDIEWIDILLYYDNPVLQKAFIQNILNFSFKEEFLIKYLLYYSDNENLELVEAALKQSFGFIKRKGFSLGKFNEILESFGKNKNTNVKILLLDLLVDTGDKRYLGFIKGFKTDKEKVICKKLESIILIGGASEKNYILSFRNDERESVKRKVFSILAEYGDSNDEGIIKENLENDMGAIRAECIRYLGIQGGEDNINIIKSYKRDPDPEVRDMIIVSLAYNVIKEAGYLDGKKINRTLGIKGGNQDYIDFIKTFSNDDDFSVKLTMMQVLWEIGGFENTDFVLSMAKDKDVRIKEEVLNLMSSSS